MARGDSSKIQIYTSAVDYNLIVLKRMSFLLRDTLTGNGKKKYIYFDDFSHFYKQLISLSNVSIFEMNIKEAYTEHIAVQTSRVDSPHETT